MAGEVAAAGAGQGGEAFGAGLGLLLKAGENKRPVNPFYDPNANTEGSRQTGYNPDATNYGGYRGGRAAYNANLNARRMEVEGRGPILANYANADQQRQARLGARTNLVDVLAAQKARALGQAPTIAQQVGQQQMGQAVATQGGIAASARGPAGLALANQVQAGNVAQAQGAITNSTQINAAQEKLAAEQAAAGGYATLANSDLNAQAQDASQEQFQAQAGLASRNANDARAMGYEGLEGRANEAELAAKTAEQGYLASSYAAQQQQAQQQAQNNANTQLSWWQKLLSDERAKICLGKGGSHMVSDERTKEVLGLAPGTKILDPTTHPVDSFGFSQDNHDDFKDPGASSPMGALKAHSDYATRYVSEPGATSFFSDQNTKYDTKLSPEQEGEFQKWFRKYAPPGERGGDYDYRGAFLAGVTPGKDKHWPDTFKKPNHATFSDESQYATGTDRFRAGAWKDDKFIAPSKPGTTNGIALSRGGANGEAVTGDPNAQQMFFDPVRGWQMPQSQDSGSAQDVIGRAALDRAIERQAQEDQDDMAIDARLEEQRARDVRMQRDAVVAPGRAPKGYAARRAAEMGYDPTMQNAPEESSSRATKLAPGTEDFERTAPKPPQQAFATSDPNSMWSDDRTKLREAFQAGVLYGGKVQEPGAEGEGDVPDYVRSSQPEPSLRQRWMQTPAHKAIKAGIGTATFGPVPAMAEAARAHLPPEMRDGAGPVGKLYAATRAANEAAPEAVKPSKTREMKSFVRDTSPIAEANRSMEGTPYAYKPGFAEASGQQPGEVNVGPMAQRMEKSEVAGTAVKTDPATGLKTIDKDKALKVVMSGVADLQRQNDELRSALVLKKGGRK